MTPCNSRIAVAQSARLQFSSLKPGQPGLFCGCNMPNPPIPKAGKSIQELLDAMVAAEVRTKEGQAAMRQFLRGRWAGR